MFDTPSSTKLYHFISQGSLQLNEFRAVLKIFFDSFFYSFNLKTDLNLDFDLCFLVSINLVRTGANLIAVAIKKV